MPVSISKHGGKYQVSTPHGVKAKGTTLAKAKSQERLLNAVDHGWKPTHNESVDRIKALIAEGRHKPGCQCGFCKNMGSFGKKKKENEEPAEPKEPDEPKEMSEGRDDINKLPMSREAKSYARRGGLASMKRQPKDYINMVAADTNQKAKKNSFKSYDAEEMSSGGAMGSKNIVTKKKTESMAQQVVDSMLNG
jgi:hypothetical protein